MLNAGRNALAGKVAVGRLKALKALILNDNQITLVGGARACAPAAALCFCWLTACAAVLNSNTLQAVCNSQLPPRADGREAAGAPAAALPAFYSGLHFRLARGPAAAGLTKPKALKSWGSEARSPAAAPPQAWSGSEEKKKKPKALKSWGSEARSQLSPRRPQAWSGSEEKKKKPKALKSWGPEARSPAAAPPPAGLERLKALNTLVLSHNAIASLGTWLAGASGLVKLSLSHNRIAEVGGALR